MARTSTSPKGTLTTEWGKPTMNIKQRLQSLTAEKILNLSVSDVAALFVQAVTEMERLEGWCATLVAQAVDGHETALTLMRCLHQLRESLIQIVDSVADELTVVHLNAFKNNPTDEKNAENQKSRHRGHALRSGDAAAASTAPDAAPGDLAAACAGGGPAPGSRGGCSGEAPTGSETRSPAGAGLDPHDERRFLASDDER